MKYNKFYLIGVLLLLVIAASGAFLIVKPQSKITAIQTTELIPDAVINPPQAITPPIPTATEPSPPVETAPSTAESAETPPAPAISNWQSNALSFTPEPNKPMLAIIIDDMGLSHYSRDVINLPGALTLSFMPYAENLAGQTKAAQNHHHEIMLHMPMQPIGRHNPGPNALYTNLSAADIKQRVEAALDKIPAAIGLNNHMGSAFTQDADGMAAVMAVLHERGLVFLDSKTIGNSAGRKTAETAQVPILARDIFLDNDETQPAIRAQLNLAERLAKRRGWAIAIGHPYPETVAVLKDWLAAPDQHMVQLVPLSALYIAKMPQ